MCYKYNNNRLLKKLEIINIMRIYKYYTSTDQFLEFEIVKLESLSNRAKLWRGEFVLKLYTYRPSSLENN